ncbi:hypothetical protein [Anaerophaga thermohalophila]|uniref:hypothetical protein n=1 Tax=Anaerophaga thermohalophila TaxID=177400 RepID=UPI001111ED69|nr:hypothetical protein [Anaerophaga thermohalophila]
MALIKPIVLPIVSYRDNGCMACPVKYNFHRVNHYRLKLPGEVYQSQGFRIPRRATKPQGGLSSGS